MSKISELTKTLQAKSEAYHKKHAPLGWIKAMDVVTGKFMLVEPNSRDELFFDSIYLATFMTDSHQFFWGYSAGNLPQSMRDMTLSIKEKGEEKRVLEFMESSLIVEPGMVDMQKLLRQQDNEAMCSKIGHDFCSKYHTDELIALASKVLEPDAFHTLEFPDHNCVCIYFLYGEPDHFVNSPMPDFTHNGE